MKNDKMRIYMKLGEQLLVVCFRSLVKKSGQVTLKHDVGYMGTHNKVRTLLPLWYNILWYNFYINTLQIEWNSLEQQR